ncbi:MAG: SEL1-like repeat protein [Chlamydiia bacterium]|nr:SEL1-like repeat protein [Chlamydiia bacterium]
MRPLTHTAVGPVDPAARKQRLKTKANKGDVEAQFSLGEKYEEGRSGFLKDLSKALKWYAKAAEKGHLEGGQKTQEIKRTLESGGNGRDQGLLLYFHARCYEKGRGYPQDVRKAVELYKKAAQANFLKGAERFERLVEQHQLDQEYETLSRMYYPTYDSGWHVNGFKKDFGKGEYWAKKAAAAGHPEAMNKLYKECISSKKPGAAEAAYQVITSFRERGGDGGLCRGARYLLSGDRSPITYFRGEQYESEDKVAAASKRVKAEDERCERDYKNHLRQRFDDLKRRAEGGDAEASYQMGLMYLENAGSYEHSDLGLPELMPFITVPEDYSKCKQEAAKWFRRALLKGHRQAEYRYQLCQEDPSKEMSRMAENGNPDAMGYLAISAKWNDRKTEADRLYRKAASFGIQGYLLTYAQFLEEMGNDQEALRYYREVVKDEHGRLTPNYVRALMAIGKFYAEGRGGVIRDRQEAIKWYKKAERSGCYQALNSLREITGDRSRSFEVPTISIDKNYCDYYGKTNNIYSPDGLVMSLGTNSEAAWKRILLQEATGGHPEAQCLVGIYYERGGVEGELRSLTFYDEGEGFPQSYAEAAKWYRKSAEQQHPNGCYHLGYLYETGKGVKKNLQEARKWYEQAAKERHLGAVAGLERLPRQNSGGGAQTNPFGVSPPSYFPPNAAGFPTNYTPTQPPPTASNSRVAPPVASPMGYNPAFGAGVPSSHPPIQASLTASNSRVAPPVASLMGYVPAFGAGVPSSHPPTQPPHTVSNSRVATAVASQMGYVPAFGAGVPSSHPPTQPPPTASNSRVAPPAAPPPSYYPPNAAGVLSSHPPTQPAAQGGHPLTAEGYFREGEKHFVGNGVVVDFVQAFVNYKKAAELGHVQGKGKLGYMYLHGLGTEKDLFFAFQWLKDSALSGVDFAQYILGTMYETGTGVGKDLPMAVVLYKKAAQQGYENAQKAVQRVDSSQSTFTPSSEKKTVISDLEQLISTLETAPVKGGETSKVAAEEHYKFGMEQYGVGKYPEAVEAFTKGAKLGNADSQFMLGYCLTKGLGHPVDWDTAEKWLQEAASQGHEKGKVTLGYLLKKKSEVQPRVSPSVASSAETHPRRSVESDLEHLITTLEKMPVKEGQMVEKSGVNSPGGKSLQSGGAPLRSSESDALSQRAAPVQSPHPTKEEKSSSIKPKLTAQERLARLTPEQKAEVKRKKEELLRLRAAKK